MWKSMAKLLRLPRNTRSGYRDRAGQRLNSLKQATSSVIQTKIQLILKMLILFRFLKTSILLFIISKLLISILIMSLILMFWFIMLVKNWLDTVVKKKQKQ